MTLPNPSTGDTVAASHITGIKDHLEGASGATAPYHLRQSSGSFIITLPDAAGATKFRVNDSGGVEVFSVNSDGTITNAGTYAPASLTLPTSASPAPTVDGNIVWDSDDNNFAVGDGSSTQLFFPDNKGANLASATTLTTTGHFHHVTGTTTVTGIAARPSGVEVVLYFISAVPLTHNATTFILRQAASRTTVPGEIIRFISEGSGNWREVSTGTNGAIASASAIQSVTSSTTYVSSTYLTQAVEANSKYDFRAKILYTAGASGDIKVQVLGPASATLYGEATRPALTSGTWTASIFTDTDLSTGTADITAEGGGTFWIRFDGIISTSAAAGTITIQFAQNTSNGTATSIEAGSFMQLVKTA